MFAGNTGGESRTSSRVDLRRKLAALTHRAGTVGRCGSKSLHKAPGQTLGPPHTRAARVLVMIPLLAFTRDGRGITTGTKCSRHARLTLRGRLGTARGDLNGPRRAKVVGHTLCRVGRRRIGAFCTGLAGLISRGASCGRHKCAGFTHRPRLAGCRVF